MKKLLTINNKKDLKNFLNLLPLYKSFIFKFTEFQLKEDKYDLENIITALNIKNRKRRIEYIYDTACQEIDDFYKGKNVCCFKDNRCISQRKANKYQDGCCRRCSYKTCGDCPTKNLACKLFYCTSVKENHQVITFLDVMVLKCLSKRQSFIVKSDFFSSREDVIMDLYIGSLFIAAIRMCYRFLKQAIKKKELV